MDINLRTKKFLDDFHWWGTRERYEELVSLLDPTPILEPREIQPLHYYKDGVGPVVGARYLYPRGRTLIVLVIGVCDPSTTTVKRIVVLVKVSMGFDRSEEFHRILDCLEIILERTDTSPVWHELFLVYTYNL